MAVDGLRIISILAVVLIHTTTRTMEASSFHLETIQWTVFLNQAARFAVPLFFMISGFVLELNYDHHPNYFAYLWKRINRIFIPYIFWSAIYYYFIYTQHGVNFLTALLYGSASWQLYFIPTLLIFYIVFPLLHELYTFITSKWIFLGLTIIQLWLLWHDYNVKSYDLFYPLGIASLNYMVFILGMVANRNQEVVLGIIRRWKLLLIFGCMAAAILVYYQGSHLYIQTHNYLRLYSQWRISITLYVLLLAAVIYGWLHKAYVDIIKKVAALSFFVFFVHIIVLENVWKYLFLPLVTHNGGLTVLQQGWFDPLFFGVTALSSLGLAWAAHKIPYFSRLTG